MTRCSRLAPTSNAPNRNEAGIVPIGWRPPKRAATIPLNPALPVNPVVEPSVTIRWDSDPKTRIAPASPQRAPLRVRARTVERLTLIPA